MTTFSDQERNTSGTQYNLKKSWKIQSRGKYLLSHRELFTKLRMKLGQDSWVDTERVEAKKWRVLCLQVLRRLYLMMQSTDVAFPLWRANQVSVERSDAAVLLPAITLWLQACYSSHTVQNLFLHKLEVFKISVSQVHNE